MPSDTFQYKRLGEILVDFGYLDQIDIDLAVSIQKTEKKQLGQILVEKGLVSWNDIAQALSKQYDLPFMDSIAELEISSDILSIINKQMAERWRVIPFGLDGSNRLKVLIDMVGNLSVLKRDIQFLTSHEPCFFIISKPNLDLLFKEYFGRSIDAVEELKHVIAEKEKTIQEDAKNITVTSEAASKQKDDEQTPIIRVVNEMIMQAIREDASDIHIEPYDKKVRVRYRIDGMLRKVAEYPTNLHSSVISRIKILSKLDISERRVPQDGKFYMKDEREQFDFRVSMLPTVYGEKAVLRLLKMSQSTKHLHELGLSDYNLKRMNYLLDIPYGIILLTGPTGSGKSTTLVGILNRLKDVSTNIVTVEDPVEYSIEGITQCQIHPEIGLTFARYLRAILRQDPDIIMVGEIRDKETAQLAVEASMTGHLVLSTLHTNTAGAAVSRLLNLGIEPDLLGVSLLGVVGQRLVRVLCNHCKRTVPFKHDEFLDIARKIAPNASLETEIERVGCQECRKVGYRGRTAIHEVLIVDKKIRHLMNENAPESMIERMAHTTGMRTMYEDGVEKALQGLTTFEEIKRVAIGD